MRTRNALDRLAAAAPAVEAPIDAGEEEWILARILESRRAPQRRGPRPAMLLAGIAVVVGAVAVGTVALVHGGNPPAPRASGGHHVALSGSKIKLAGYHFRTPAGFTSSSTACAPLPPPATVGAPVSVMSGFSAAASAEGGCLQAALIRDASDKPPLADAQAVTVGPYSGNVISRGSEVILLVYIPAAEGDHVLILTAQGLTAEQLVAVAESGLPTSIPPTTTCTADCG